jgi:hypothetical protein
MYFPRFVSMLDHKALFFVKASKFCDLYEGTVPNYNDLNRVLVYEEQEIASKVKNNLIDL